MNDDVIQMPTLVVQFKTSEELNNTILTVYVKTLSDMIHAAKDDRDALYNLNRMFTEGKWITGDLLDKLYQNNH